MEDFIDSTKKIRDVLGENGLNLLSKITKRKGEKISEEAIDELVKSFVEIETSEKCSVV